MKLNGKKSRKNMYSEIYVKCDNYFFDTYRLLRLIFQTCFFVYPECFRSENGSKCYRLLYWFYSRKLSYEIHIHVIWKLTGLQKVVLNVGNKSSNLSFGNIANIMLKIAKLLFLLDSWVIMHTW